MRGVRLRSRTSDHRRRVICRGYGQRTGLRIVATISLTGASRCLCSNESGNPSVRWIAPTQRGVIVASSKPPWNSRELVAACLQSSMLPVAASGAENSCIARASFACVARAHTPVRSRLGSMDRLALPRDPGARTDQGECACHSS